MPAARKPATATKRTSKPAAKRGTKAAAPAQPAPATRQLDPTATADGLRALHSEETAPAPVFACEHPRTGGLLLHETATRTPDGIAVVNTDAEAAYVRAAEAAA